MNHQTGKLILCPLVLGMFVSCAGTPQKVEDMDKPRISQTELEDSRQVTTAAAKEVGAYNFVEINFPTSSSTLSKSAIASLESAIAQAKQKGDIREIVVLSWADQEYPSKSMNKLNKREVALADQRNSAIEKYLASVNQTDVDVYNMSERPGKFSNWFNTMDTKIKDSLISAGLPTTADDPQYPSKASHAVILLKVE